MKNGENNNNLFHNISPAEDGLAELLRLIRKILVQMGPKNKTEKVSQEDIVRISELIIHIDFHLTKPRTKLPSRWNQCIGG